MVIKGHLRTQLGRRLHPFVAEHVTLGTLRGKDQELEIVVWKTELFVDIVVVFASFISCSTGAVEASSGIDA